MKTLIVKFKNALPSYDDGQRGEKAKGRHKLIMDWLGSDNVVEPLDLDDRTCEVKWCSPKETSYEKPVYAWTHKLTDHNWPHPVCQEERLTRHFKDDPILYIYEDNVNHGSQVDLRKFAAILGVGFIFLLAIWAVLASVL